jgi:phosphoadenosine phosphosulfate reductase
MDKEKFTEDRTKRCEDLMRPEIREMLGLPLEEKIAKSREIIKEALAKYPKVGLGFSGGTDSLVLLHVAKPVIPADLPIIFVNTRLQFQKTYDFIEKIKKDWDIKNFIEVKPEKERLQEFIDKFGSKTAEFTAVCCNYHKISPLMKAIKDLGLQAFIAGIRGVEHEERAKETIFSPRETHFRVHPLLFWKRQDVLDYVKIKGIESNPLYKEGYTSLGCEYCTDKNPNPEMHERAGRGQTREEVMEKLREMGYT